MKKFLIFLSSYLAASICLVKAPPPLQPNNVCLPNLPWLKSKQLSPPFSTCSADVKKQLGSKHPDQDKDTGQVLQTYKYPYKEYNVTTKDGYILKVYRITGSPNNKGKQKGKKQAVYLQHGLAAASDTWFFQPGSRNLPFKLADAGYEVWLGNARGTTYSQGHTKYNANTDLAYWDFSFHEMGMYDVPAVTDKILSETKNKKIFYIGHSMGTTMFFVSLSEIPQMNKKFKAGFMLAPIAFIGHSNTPLRLAFPLMNTHPMYLATNLLFQGRVQSAGQFREKLKLSPGDFCDLTATKCGVCDNLVFLLFGYDAPQMNNTELPNMAAKFPNTFSIKTTAHYSQGGTKCNFKKYDYGAIENAKRYKNAVPPDYKLQNIKPPIYFIYGENDNLGPPNDVNITASKFSKGVIQAMYKVPLDLFNHIDHQAAKDADKLEYNYILKQMKKFK